MNIFFFWQNISRDKRNKQTIDSETHLKTGPNSIMCNNIRNIQPHGPIFGRRKKNVVVVVSFVVVDVPPFEMLLLFCCCCSYCCRWLSFNNLTMIQRNKRKIQNFLLKYKIHHPKTQQVNCIRFTLTNIGNKKYSIINSGHISEGKALFFSLWLLNDDLTYRKSKKNWYKFCYERIFCYLRKSKWIPGLSIHLYKY